MELCARLVPSQGCRACIGSSPSYGPTDLPFAQRRTTKLPKPAQTSRQGKKAYERWKKQPIEVLPLLSSAPCALNREEIQLPRVAGDVSILSTLSLDSAFVEAFVQFFLQECACSDPEVLSFLWETGYPDVFSRKLTSEWSEDISTAFARMVLLAEEQTFSKYKAFLRTLLLARGLPLSSPYVPISMPEIRSRPLDAPSSEDEAASSAARIFIGKLLHGEPLPAFGDTPAFPGFPLELRRKRPYEV